MDFLTSLTKEVLLAILIELVLILGHIEKEGKS